MNLYLAARYSRRHELLEYREALNTLGYGVTSRWLNGPNQLTEGGKPLGTEGEQAFEDGSAEVMSEVRSQFAEYDLEDIRLADYFVAFTEEPRSNHSRGGRHVELGYALGLRKPIALIGPRENIFCWLDGLPQFDTWEEFVQALEFRDSERVLRV